MSSNVTPYVVIVKIIDANGGVMLDTDVTNELIVNSVAYSTTLNDINSAQVGITPRTDQARQFLRKLFPYDNPDGAYFSELQIWLKGFATDYSTLKKDFMAFSGLIVGLGSSITPQSDTVVLNVRGPFFRLQNVPLLMPGVHTTTPYAFQLSPTSFLSKNGDETGKRQFVESITAFASTESLNGFEFFRYIIDQYLEQITKVTTGAGGIESQVFSAATQSFGFAGNKPNFLDEELQKFTSLAPAMDSAPLYEDRARVCNSIVWQVLGAIMSNPALTFWELLQTIAEIFGLNLVFAGGQVFGITKQPLQSPVANNYLPATDMLAIQHSEEPFTWPTRVIVSEYNEYNGFTMYPDKTGIYPPGDGPTPQEAKTGMFTYITRAPGFLFNIPVGKEMLAVAGNPQTIRFRKTDNLAQTMAEQVAAAKDNSSKILRIVDLYAQYVYMDIRFRQRTASVNCRYRPELLPGFCAQVDDPRGLASFVGMIESVSHNLDAANANASTTVTFSSVRFGKELEPNPFPNPFYQNHEVDAVADAILALIGLA